MLITEETIDLTDYLSEQEIELVNYLRGFDADGEEAPANWALTINRLPEGRWRVSQTHGEYEMLGENVDFDSAWIDQCDPRLREPPTDEEKASAIRLQPSDHPPAPKPSKPMLRVIRGGKDSG